GGQTRHWTNGHGPVHYGNGSSHPEERLDTLSRFWTTERNGGTLRSPAPYVKIRRQCLERGIIWEDPDFLPSYKLLQRSKKSSYPVVWLRPHELTPHPRFSGDTPWRMPLEAGLQGDIWLLLALTTLSTTPRLLERIVPLDQSFDHGYSGVFRFRFWQFGSWVEVCVDDRLPSCRGRPIGLSCADPTQGEFWPALLEKAYAKLYGGYDKLHEGSGARALQDLTGGIVQSFGLNSQDRYLTYQVLNSAVPRSTLIVASILPDRERRALKLRHGLITHSAYDVTGLARVRDTGNGNSTIGETPLVRLRGPYGRGQWVGPWSDRSIEWESLPERDKEVLSVRTRTDGEFWMSFVDFVRNFTHLELVHIGPDDWLQEPSLQPRKPWRAVLAKRRWRLGYNAGGGPDFIETTAMNPQFVIQIPRGVATKCHVVVAVTQQYGGTGDNNTAQPAPNNKDQKSMKSPFHAIGFAVYEARPNVNRITPQFVAENRPLDVTQHSVSREVATFFALPPGEYVIIPQTKLPNCEARFLLRILTDEQSTIWEVNEDNILYRSFTLDSFDSTLSSNDIRQVLLRWSTTFPSEIDAVQFRKLLKSKWKLWLWTKPTLELSKSLIMLRDSNISGRLAMKDMPALLNMLLFWKAAFHKWDKGKHGKTSSYNMRGMLWEAGVGVSNKVLECLILRFARDANLTSECFLMALLRLHLAHERYHALDTKTKSNPLSLEEMILMTIYS
ncbi:Calpain-B, partial [Orchesella cincta]